MGASVELSVVMPVYNEASVLQSVLEEVQSSFEGVSYSFEILLANDASTDASGTILDRFAAKHPQFRILHLPQNLGIMGALSVLMREAKGKYIFFNSSDGQFETSDCVRMMELRDQFDMIIGERKKKIYTFRRHLISWSFNFLCRFLFFTKTYDAGSIKLYRREILDIPLLSQSPFREAERILRAKKYGFRVGRIFVKHHSRKGGLASGSRLSLVLHSLWDLLLCLKIHFEPKRERLTSASLESFRR
jgi:dolichol-phosphate mannosyltransferase